MTFDITWKESDPKAFEIFKKVPGKVDEILNGGTPEALLDQISEDFLQRLKENFYANRTDRLKSLSRAYARRKQLDPTLDERLLLATKELVGYLRIYKRGKRRKLVGAGTRRHKRSGMSAGALLMLLEHGSPGQNIPARPVVSLTWEENRDELIEDLEKEFTKELRQKGLL